MASELNNNMPHKRQFFMDMILYQADHEQQATPRHGTPSTIFMTHRYATKIAKELMTTIVKT